MRSRPCDPMLQGTTDEDAALRDMSCRDKPPITEEADGSIALRLPLYHTRRKLIARDARSVVAAYILDFLPIKLFAVELIIPVDISP